MTREEAIEVYNGLLNQKIIEAFEFFAPELKESEDERIRKAIIHYILYETKGTISEDTEHTWVKWLEKQKEQKPVPISCSHENGTSAEVCYGPKGDPDPAGVWKPSEEMKQNYIRKDAIMELLQGMIQSCKTKNGFPADTLAAMRIDTLETVISRIEEICKEERK